MGSKTRDAQEQKEGGAVKGRTRKPLTGFIEPKLHGSFGRGMRNLAGKIFQSSKLPSDNFASNLKFSGTVMPFFAFQWGKM